MRGFALRFSLRWLIALVTVAGVVSAALANPTQWWASGVFSGTLVLLCVALLVAVARRGEARAAALGFAICGAFYLGLILAPGAETNIEPFLLTSKALHEAEARWYPDVRMSVNPPGVLRQRIRFNINGTNSYSLISPGQTAAFSPPGWQISSFQRVGHCLWALLFAASGSFVSRWSFVRGTSPAAES
jgi:hypothetical protein